MTGTAVVALGGRLAVITTAALAATTLRSQGDDDTSVGTRIVPALDR